jgi:serine/threonine protein kinase
MPESWPHDALPRDTLLHGYRIIQVLGRGGFGITYKAVDRIDQFFAIKEYFPRQFSVRRGAEVVPADDESATMFNDCLERFTNEARALTKFSSQAGGVEGVVRVITYFEAHGTAYIVMEFLQGQCFDRVIAANPEGLPENDLMRILRTLLPALARVHANHLLHRDIKPANIFVRGNGTPVLLDFGAARVNQPGQTDTYSRIFTENYAPIEQMQGLPQGPYSDIYALGVTCYQAIAGRAYAPAGTMSITRQAAMLGRQRDPLPSATELGAGRYAPPVLQAIDWSLAVMPQDRPQNVGSLAAAFGLRLPEEFDTEDTTRLMAPSPAGGAADNDATTVLPPDAPTVIHSRAATVLPETIINAPTQIAPRVPAQQKPSPAATPAWLLPAGVAIILLLAVGGVVLYENQKTTAPKLVTNAKPSTATPPEKTVPQSPAPAPKPASAPNTSGDAALAAGDTTTALQRFREAADTGDKHAQYMLGYMYQNGNGVMADFTTALEWYNRAAASNYAPAQSQIGFMNLTGQAGAKNYAAAQSWFALAAKQHYAPAEYQLGYMAQHGLGMKRNFPQMLDWYIQAADQNYPQAQQQLGYCYQMGLGVEKNPGEAVHWYTLAAQQNLPTAMFSLGQMYYNGLGVATDQAAGRDWISRAAAAGNSDARRWLAEH